MQDLIDLIRKYVNKNSHPMKNLPSSFTHEATSFRVCTILSSKVKETAFSFTKATCRTQRRATYKP